MDGCCALGAVFDFIEFRHVYREANSVAYRLAHFASLGRVVDFCVDEIPAFINDVLYEDISNAASEVELLRACPPRPSI